MSFCAKCGAAVFSQSQEASQNIAQPPHQMHPGGMHLQGSPPPQQPYGAPQQPYGIQGMAPMRPQNEFNKTLAVVLIALGAPLVIGIFVAIAIPVFFSSSDGAAIRACHSNQRTFDSAIMQYNAATTGQWPANLADLDPYISGGSTGISCPGGGTYSLSGGPPPIVTCSEAGHARDW